MEITLYDNDLATPTRVADLSTRVEGLHFSTRLPGGFNVCTFSLQCSQAEAWEWVLKRYFYRLLITDMYKTLWEGRLEDVEIGAGEIEVTFYGYYANLSDVPYDTAYNDVASTVIKAVLTACCAQINADQTNIETTDITITSAADESYLDIYPQELVDKLLAFGDSSQYIYDFAIWEDRIPYLIKRDISSLDWSVYLQDLDNFRLLYQLKDLWNSVYAIYKVAGALTRTADADDTDSQTKYGLKRQYVVPDVGEVVAASAQAARDLWLAEHKETWPKLRDLTLSDRVYTVNGVPTKSSWVRAGEVIRIKDLIPATVNASAVTRDRMTTYFILETDYDADAKTNSLVVETQPLKLTDLLVQG